jgi:hypothetical protein
MIRPAQHSDTPVLVGLVMSFFSNGELDGTGLTPDPVTLEFFIEDAINADDSCILVAEVDGQVVGAIAGEVSRWWCNYDNICLVERGWFIPKENRGKYPMAAMSLRKQFHKWGKERGATTLVMVSTVREESPRVMEMYKKSGLKHIDNNFIGRL